MARTVYILWPNSFRVLAIILHMERLVRLFIVVAIDILVDRPPNLLFPVETADVQVLRVCDDLEADLGSVLQYPLSRCCELFLVLGGRQSAGVVEGIL